MAPPRRYGGVLMPGFYTDRSKSFDYDKDYNLGIPYKTLVVNGETYLLGGYDAPYKNSFVTFGIDGSRKLGPKINGRVRGIVSDNYGGYYIYGDFIKVNEKIRIGMAHFDSSGRLTEWNAGLNSNSVRAAVTNGPYVYIGGNFSSAKGLTRNRLAAFSLSGQILSWSPSLNGTFVYDMVISGSNIYIAGNFTSVDLITRNYLAAVNTSGSVLTWNPSASADVLELEIIGSNIYMGGSFTSVNGNVRNRLAAVNTSGSVLTWNPSADSTVSGMTVIGNNIYIGGNFISISSTSRNLIAAINTSGSLLSWDPLIQRMPGDGIADMTSNGSNIYIGGIFQLIGGVRRQGSAIVNTNGNVLSLDIPDYNTIYSQDRRIYQFGDNIYVYAQIYTEDRTFGIYKIDKYGEVKKFLNVDRDINDATFVGDNIYFGGNFKIVGGSWSSHSKYDTSGNDITDVFATTKNYDYSEVLKIKADGVGGYYIGGIFDSINGIKRTCLAHINSSGSVSDFNVNIFGPDGVYAMEIIGSNIYLGGGFLSVNGSVRKNLAAVNTSGSLLDWNPDASNDIRAMAVSGNNIYVGGYFTSVNGNVRNYLAAINTSGNVLTWNPSASNAVKSLAISGSNIYIGGFFTSINGNARNRIAAVNTSGNVLTWNPSANSTINDIEIIGDNIYLGGNFTLINGNARNYLAAVNTSGNVLAWNPSADSTVSALAISGVNIYFGGYISQVSGVIRYGFAAVNTSGSLLSWIPYYGDNWDIGGSEVEIIGSNIHLGWYYTGLFGPNAVPRHNLAAVNTSGSILSWNPSANANVSGIATRSNGDVYFGGDFTSVNGETDKLRLAGFRTNGTSVSHGFNVSGNVNSIFFEGNDLYFTGSFNVVSGLQRQNFAGFNTAAYNEVLEIAPFFSSRTDDIQIQDNVIYVSGAFTNLGSNTSYHVVTQSGVETIVTAVNSYDATFGEIDAIVPDGLGGVYIGGLFDFVDGKRRLNLAHINSSGKVTNWNPSASNSVYALAKIADNIYIGGFFTSINGNARNRIAAVNTSGALLDWNPSASASVSALAVSGDNIYIGGQFTSVNGNTRNLLAAVNTSGNVLTWNPSAGSTVYTLGIIGSNIYIGGNFTTISGQARGRLAAVNTAGTLLTWSPSAGSTVSALAISGVNIYFGGSFTTVNLTTRNRIAAVNVSASLLTWNPNVNNTVRAIATSGVNVYFGGDFTTVDGVTRNRAAAENVSGSLLSWDPNLTSNCWSLVISGDNVYIGGRSGLSGTSPVGASYLALLDINGSSVSQPTVPITGVINGQFQVHGDNLYISGTTGNFNPIIYGASYLYLVNSDGRTLYRYATYDNSTSTAEVYSITIDGSGGAYLGGKFQSINGITAKNIAYINSSGSVVSWSPSTNGNIHEILVSGDNIYLAGEFTEVNGVIRNRLAVVNTLGSLLSWNPNVNGTIYDLVLDGSNLYIGGNFTSVNGNVRNRLAAVNTSGNVLAWNPNANVLVAEMDIIGTNIYIAGEFTTLGFTSRQYLAAVNTAGTIQTWNPSANLGVYALEVSGQNVFIGGNFSSIAATAREGFAVVNTAGSLQTLNANIVFNKTGAITNWTVSKITIDSSNIYVAGLSIETAGGLRRPGGFGIDTSGNMLNFSLLGHWISRIVKFGDNFIVSTATLGATSIIDGESKLPSFLTFNKSDLKLKSISIETDTSREFFIKDDIMIIPNNKQVFDIFPSYKITDQRLLNAVEQGLE